MKNLFLTYILNIFLPFDDVVFVFDNDLVWDRDWDSIKVFSFRRILNLYLNNKSDNDLRLLRSNWRRSISDSIAKFSAKLTKLTMASTVFNYFFMGIKEKKIIKTLKINIGIGINFHFVVTISISSIASLYTELAIPLNSLMKVM